MTRSIEVKKTVPVTLVDSRQNERRARKRIHMPGRAFLSWLLSGSEAVGIALFLMFVADLNAAASLLGTFFWIVFTYPSWYLFLGGQATLVPMLVSAVGAWILSAGIAVVAALVLGAEFNNDLCFSCLSLGFFGLLLFPGLRALLAVSLVQVITQGRLQFEKLGIVGQPEEIRNFLKREQIWQRGWQPSRLHEMATPDPEALQAFLTSCIAHGCTRVLFLPDRLGIDRQQLEDICDRFSIDAYFASDPFDPTQLDWIAEQPIGFTGAIVKRLFDVVVSSLLLIGLSPLLLITALVIRLETPGPSLFRQERMGFNGLSFMIYKFRSMRVMEDGRTMKQAKREDTRITRIGRFIRATSIDELPQLLNVLRGEMSLVGPRPHALLHNTEMERAVARNAHRNRLKPGITGWAQVNGYRGDTSTQEKMEGRVALDLYYIEHWSLTFDIKILFLTVFSKKARQNAF
jgi:polysaccharide biosynthesis protein PslA